MKITFLANCYFIRFCNTNMYVDTEGGLVQCLVKVDNIKISD